MTTAEETLNQSFRTIGKKYGYDTVDAEFVAYRDFKVRWTRSYKWVEFQVSDYLLNAPSEVMEGLAETLFSKISGMEPKPYSKEMAQWVSSDAFVAEKQPVYLRRSRNLSKRPEGVRKDLSASLKRIKEMGLVRADEDPFLTWTKEPLSSMAGYCSTLMNTIVVSSSFDSESIPDSVLDYVLYREYLVIREGRVNFGKEQYFDMGAEEKKFPGWQEAEGWIRKMCLHF